MIGLGMLRRKMASATAARSTPVLTAEAAARSHVGKVREINEDRFLVRSECGLWAVADGMGGHAAGSDAAETAINELAKMSDMCRPLSDEVIEGALREANRRIRTRARALGANSGATIVVAWLSASRLSVYWAGDSRAYQCRDGVWQCLTRDHSVVQELLDRGEITRAQADRHPWSNLVTRALGGDDNLRIEKVVAECKAGDHLLLCSDGVSRTLELLEGEAERGSLGEFADAVLSAALSRDGSDNATLVAIAAKSLPLCSGDSAG